MLSNQVKTWTLENDLITCYNTSYFFLKFNEIFVSETIQELILCHRSITGEQKSKMSTEKKLIRLVFMSRARCNCEKKRLAIIESGEYNCIKPYFQVVTTRFCNSV